MALNESRGQQLALTTLAPAARITTGNGTGVDLVAAGAVTVHLQVGVVTDGTHTITLQESVDNSTFTAVGAGDQSGTLTALASNVNQKIGYIGNKRYIRAVATLAGATVGGVYGALVIQTDLRKQPQ